MDEETRQFLRDEVAGARLSAHLATSVDDRPHVAPVWYVYEERDGEGKFAVLTGGRKLRNIRENPRVAVSIERTDEGEAVWRVVARGTARVVDDTERTAAARQAVFETYYGADYDETATEEGGRLVEITVGSADVERYDR